MLGSSAHTGPRAVIDAQRSDGLRDEGDLLTADEVAVMLRMTKAWVYAQTRANRIPHLALGRYVRYRRSAVHLAPYFGESKAIDRIEARDIARYVAVKASRGGRARRGGNGEEGLSRKTIVNHLNFAHGVFAFAVKHGWCVSNPVAATDRPQMEPADPDIRFLALEEFEALLRAAAQRASSAREDGDEPAGAGTPMRTLQEWMGHRNIATTEIYADYAPDPAYGAEFAERMFTAKKTDGDENTEHAKDGEVGPAQERDAALDEESGVDDAA